MCLVSDPQQWVTILMCMCVVEFRPMVLVTLLIYMRVSRFRPLAMGDGVERHHAPGSHGDHSRQSFLSKVAAGWCNKLTPEKTKREKSRD